MNASRPAVSIIIPNWNGAHHLSDCLDSLVEQTWRDFEVVVVDNGSTDTSLDLLALNYDWVRVIALDINDGFSSAVNAGIRQTESDWIVLLNNDTRAKPDWLEQLVAGMERHPEASFAACKMLHFDPPHRIDSAGDGFSILAGAGINIGVREPGERYSEDAWVFGACAGAAIYRRSLFDDIGLFDEDFFLVFEDVDLDMRAQVAGHRCLYIADAVVFHKRGASTDNASMEVISRSWRNAIWVAGKNLPPLLLMVWAVLFAFRMGRSILMSLLFRAWRLFNPKAQPRNTTQQPAASWRQGVVMSWYLPAFRGALAALPAKRRQTRHLRRTGSLRLLPILLRPYRPITSTQGQETGSEPAR